MLNVLDLFSGIGGFSLGLERTGGFQTVAFCEFDEAAQKVLKKHWPNVPIHKDVRGLTKADLPFPIHVICGGFPCQDISLIGNRKGIIGERSGLWSEYKRLIEETKPQYAIIENVSALRYNGLTLVLQDLCQIGYSAEFHCIPASAVGAPHQRDRLWIVAYPDNSGLEGHTRHEDTRGEPDASGSIATQSLLRRTDAFPWWSVEPAIRRVVDGVPNRVDRLKQLGNAVVPQIPELIGRAILERIKQCGR